MLTEAQKQEFQTRGFLHYGKIIDDALADAMYERMFAVMENRGEGKAESVSTWGDPQQSVVVQIVNMFEADSLFREYIYHPTLCALVAELMNADTVRVWHDQLQYKPPVIGGPTDWHQDHPLWPIIQPADLISAWIALDDALVDNGCMRMVPGSHLWGAHKRGNIGSNPEDFTPTPDLSQLPPDVEIEIVPCEVRKGEVMFHHCLTWHGSPPNRTERGRPGFAVHYMPGYTRYVPGKDGHLVEHNVEVAPGEILQGDHFPTVWENGKPKQGSGIRD